MTRKKKDKSFIQKNFHLIVVGAVVLIVGAIYAGKKNTSSAAVNQSDPVEAVTAEGTPAPDFTLTSTDGKSVTLSQFRGKVVIVDFWATWCPPCKAEIPDFIKLYSNYKGKGLQMLGISVDQGGLGAVVPFMKDYGINYPILMATEEVVSAYGGIRGIPTTFVIDKKGNIRASYVGYRDASVFENIVKQLLDEK